MSDILCPESMFISWVAPGFFVCFFKKGFSASPLMPTLIIKNNQLRFHLPLNIPHL